MRRQGAPRLRAAVLAAAMLGRATAPMHTYSVWPADANKALRPTVLSTAVAACTAVLSKRLDDIVNRTLDDKCDGDAIPIETSCERFAPGGAVEGAVAAIYTPETGAEAISIPKITDADVCDEVADMLKHFETGSLHIISEISNVEDWCADSFGEGLSGDFWTARLTDWLDRAIPRKVWVRSWVSISWPLGVPATLFSADGQSAEHRDASPQNLDRGTFVWQRKAFGGWQEV